MKNLVEILAQIGGISSFACIIWILLKYMKGLPSIVMQWVLIGYAIVGLCFLICILIKNFILVLI